MHLSEQCLQRQMLAWQLREILVCCLEGILGFALGYNGLVGGLQGSVGNGLSIRGFSTEFVFGSLLGISGNLLLLGSSGLGSLEVSLCLCSSVLGISFVLVGRCGILLGLVELSLGLLNRQL